MATTAHRLQLAMERRNVDQTALAIAVGCTQGAISQILLGLTQRSRFLPDIALFLNVGLEWLKGAGEDADLDKQSPDLVAALAKLEDLDLVPIAEIDLEYGMGGAFHDDPETARIHQFPRQWLASITSTPSTSLFIARGRGDSMQPTIYNGDMLMIDRSQRSVREQDMVWAFTIGEMSMVKRLRVRGENVTILSDNATVPDDHAHPDEINVVGRVVFIGRRM